MSGLIRNQKFFSCGKPDAVQVILMCWFGGKVWQLRRLVRVLNRAGYDVTAMDFPKTILSAGDIQLLPSLASEVTERAEAIAKESKTEVLLIGISIGGLMALNVLRRSKLFTKGILITGGDVAKAAKRFYKKAWPQDYEELAEQWQSVNMYSDPKGLRGKTTLFVMHPSSKLIDARDVYHEVERQQKAGNRIMLVKRHRFDHIGTILEEATLQPQRVLDYIAQVE